MQSLTFIFLAILGKSHYLLYSLVAAMQPRMLVTLDSDLKPLPVNVRVGQVNRFFCQFKQVTLDFDNQHGASLYFDLKPVNHVSVSSFW